MKPADQDPLIHPHTECILAMKLTGLNKGYLHSNANSAIRKEEKLSFIIHLLIPSSEI